MKILMLSRTFPFPLNSGAKIRVYHVLRELSARHEVTLVSLFQEDSEITHLEDLHQLCYEVYPFKLNLPKIRSAAKSILSGHHWDVAAFRSQALRKCVNELLKTRKFDILWIHFLSMTANIDFKLARDSLAILDQHNADELFWESYEKNSSNPLLKIFAKQDLIKLKQYQKKVLGSIDAILCVSEQDAQYMKRNISSSAEIMTVPNGVDIDYFIPNVRADGQNDGNIIIFCGSMHVTMNIEAVLYFANTIFPYIQKTSPDAQLWIVGKDPSKQVRDLGKREGIVVTGSVEDVRPYYEKSKVLIAPFKLGGGTKLKILEAMAMKVPVVSTSVGCQGIDVQSGKHLIIEDNPQKFAGAVIDVMQNVEKASELARNGRTLVEEKYSWARIMTNMEPELGRLVRDRRAQ